MDKDRLNFYWKIGKFLFRKKKYASYLVIRLANVYSYKYGRSYTYSKKNINNMKLFYLCFPSFYDNMAILSWEHYLELIKISDSVSRCFYFKIAILCKLLVTELNYLININYFQRI